jgi:hypothetical protein
MSPVFYSVLQKSVRGIEAENTLLRKSSYGTGNKQTNHIFPIFDIEKDIAAASRRAGTNPRQASAG